MKNKILIWALFLMTVFSACENEYVAPGPPLTDFNLYTSQFRNTLGYKIGVNDFISFADLSQGELSHTWTIPESCVFLEGSITRQDSVFDQFMIPGLETTKKTIHVLFTKPGIQPVHLYDTFKDSVSYRTLIPFPAKRIGDKWVIDTTFMVDVYDTLAPQYKIIQDGVDLPGTKDTIYVEAGASLTFVDMTIQGRPDTRAWKVGTETAKDSVSTIVFKKLGAVTGTFAASRTSPDIPGGYKMVKISSVIKVIPSTKPWILAGTIKELENQTLQLPFNGEFLPFLNKTSFFKVKVNGTEFAISSIAINATDKTILEIKLAEPIYRPDVITVSLLAGSGIQSGDYRTIKTFEDVPVVMHNVNLFNSVVYGFEDGATLPTGWILTQGAGMSYSKEQAASGTYSLKLDNVKGADWTRASGEMFPINVEAGKTYTITYKVWIDPSTTTASFGPWFYWENGVSGQQFWQGTSGKPRGEWITISKDQLVTVSGPAWMTFRVNGGAVMYFDDVTIVETEIRP